MAHSGAAIRQLPVRVDEIACIQAILVNDGQFLIYKESNNEMVRAGILRCTSGF